MTPKLIGYTAHARKNLRERHITRQDVRALLARGTRTAEGDTFRVTGYIRRREAAVIFTEDAIRILVITVLWRDER